MARALDRTEYCRLQAAECASAAAITSLPEVREAYLNMERAWLELAPGMDGDQNPETKDHAARRPLLSRADVRALAR